MISDTISKYYKELKKCTNEMTIMAELEKQSANNITSFEACISVLTKVISDYKTNGNNVFFIGNGGSASIASHMTTDYMKNGGIKTVSFFDSSILTCMGNDFGYENVFSKPLEMQINENDLLVAISSSGNSKNIINAIKVAKEHNAKVITLTGFQPNNEVRQMGDTNLYVPSMKYGIVESIHNMVLQAVVDMLVED